MKDKVFLIYARSYDENSGGRIVLHKLCSILNELGYKAYLVPFIPQKELSYVDGVIRPVLSYLKSSLLYRVKRSKFKTNPSFITPIYSGKLSDINDDYVVIYPEIVSGNPLNAKNVVRWFLHVPGFFSGKVHYCQNELYFRFRDGFIDGFDIPNSKLSDHLLHVIDIPTYLYNLDNVKGKRSGTAYAIRKGRNKPICHDLSDSTLIDGKSHREVAEIFKRVKTFISYDADTAYSRFAALCGCESIVIPDLNRSKEQWKPDPAKRYGIAYGIDDIKNVTDEDYLLLFNEINKEIKNSSVNVEKFVDEVNKYFF